MSTFGPVRSFIRRWTEVRERRRLRGRVSRTLALTPRGAILRDHLSIRTISNHLEIEWYARPPHPWDADLPSERQTELFVIAALSDTIVAIHRMFERLPEMDTIAIRVLEPEAPHQTLLAGTVRRADLMESGRCPSPAMSLKLLGIQYRVAEGAFQPL